MADEPFRRRRTLAAGAILLAVLCVYAALLIRMQVTDAAVFRAEPESALRAPSRSSAPRGNIYDRNKYPGPWTRESYAIQIDRAQCRGEAFAQAVCRLASILEEQHRATRRPTPLPVSRTEPFAFTEENCFDPGSDTARLKDALGLDGGASPRQVLAALAGDAACAETPAPATRARRRVL